MANKVSTNVIFELLSSRGSAPAAEAETITVSDGTDDPNGAFRSLWVGAAGSVKVTTIAGNTATFVGATAGSVLPIAVTRIWSTGTTVSTPNTNILGLR